MRSINRSAILELIRQDSPIGRTQIAQRLSMSLPTVMRIVDELLEENLVRASDNTEWTGGRRRALLEFNGAAYAVVGIDLGGIRMFGTVADLSGNIQYETYIPYHDGISNSLEGLYGLIQELLDAPRPEGQRIRGISIGAPGVTISPEGVVVWAPGLQWRNLPLKRLLTDRFNLPVFVNNDANLAALGEWGFGAGQGIHDLVCFYVGRGMGAGIIVGDVLCRGHNQAAGEVGYLVPGIEFLGQPYDNFGALEYLASGMGVFERTRQLIGQGRMPTPEGVFTVHDVFTAARQGEAWAQKIVDETIKYLTLAMVAISSLLNPEVIILSGTFAQWADLLIDPILHHLRGVVPYVPRLVASPLGHRAVVMGAILLVLNETAEYSMVKRLP
jgi:predicted NBD/HSP70 family sugar kinase